jgi:uncharacterized protein (TIGR03067 family)
MIDPLSDLDVLQGTWEQVGFEENGSSKPQDEHGATGAMTTFSQNRFMVRTLDGILLLEGTFELDPLSSPKAVDWIDMIGPDAGKRLPAIYKLEKDRFIFIAADAGAPRPVVFRTAPGQTMRTFIRRA